MSCHNSHGARKVLTALRSIDTTITEKDSSFWHKTLGTHRGATGKASHEESVAAVDAAWMAATKNNPQWSGMTPEERLTAQTNFRELRGDLESGDLALTSNQVLKLSAYTTKRKPTPTITRVGAVAAGLLIALGVVTAGTPNAEAATVHKPITANSQNAEALHMAAGKKNMCREDFALAKASKTHKVTWQKPDGKITSKTMKKGSKACIYTGNDGSAVPAMTDASGVITGLPANFPKNPTASDIASLGLTPDSKVANSIRLPQPTGKPLTAPKLANKIMPVAVSGTTMEKVESGTGYIQKKTIWVEWDVQGGEGALAIPGKDPNTGEIHTRYVKLDPNGSTRVTIPLTASGEADRDGNILYNFVGTVVPDYGQTSVPQSMSRDWNLEDQRAMDDSGRGFTAGLYSNTAYTWWQRPDEHPSDGWVKLGPDGTITGTPNW